MGNLTVSNTTLALSFVLVLIAVFISYREKLGLEKDILISVFRAAIQLFIVGYVLKFVIHVNNVWLTGAMILIIMFNAARIASQRGKGIPGGTFWSSFLAIAVGTVVTLTILIWSGSIKFIPSQTVTVAGMIASNTMMAIGLCYKNMVTEFDDRHQQVLEKLALGADVKLASSDIIRDSIKTGMAPTIDNTKALGLVSLPGMMSGLIFAGVDPVKAIKYQLMVAFMLIAATSIGSIIAVYLAYKKFYNKRKQLIV